MIKIAALSDFLEFNPNPNSIPFSFFFFFLFFFFLTKNLRFEATFDLRGVITRISVPSNVSSDKGTYSFCHVHLRDETGTCRVILFNNRVGDISKMQVGQTVNLIAATCRKQTTGPFPVEIVMDRQQMIQQTIRESPHRLPINIKIPISSCKRLSSVTKVSSGNNFVNLLVQVMKTSASEDGAPLSLTIADDSAVSTVQIASLSTHDAFAAQQIYYFENLIAISQATGMIFRFNHNSNYILEPESPSKRKKRGNNLD